MFNTEDDRKKDATDKDKNNTKYNTRHMIMFNIYI